MAPTAVSVTPSADGKESAPEDSILFEEILERCCGTGRWQVLLISYMSVMWLIFPTFSMSMMFVGATPEFKCADGFDMNATFSSLPAETPQCHPSNDNSSSCTRWVYDDSVYESTVVTEWDLVCGRKPMLSMLQSLLMLGGIAGSLIGGRLTDRFGRRPVFMPAMLLVIACSFSAALVGDYVSFAVVRTFTGIAMASQFVLVTELGGCKHRAALNTVQFVPFSIGIILVAVSSYGIRTRWLLQLAFAVPSLLFLPNYWLMPESPRWLVVRGRFQEALEILRQGARWNRRQMPPDEEVLKLMKEAHRGLLAREAAMKSGGSALQRAFDLVRTWRMCLYTFTSAYIGFAISGSYFGISFDMTQLSSSPHLALGLSGLVELPTSFVFPLMNRFGRRKSQAAFLFVPALSMILVFVGKDGTFWMVLGLVAKIGVASAFTVIGIYVSEFMPTQQRGLALGVLQTSYRIGGAVSPFVVDLVSGLHELAPSAVFGAVMLLASLATLLLPETAGQPMPETVADVEAAASRKAAPAQELRGVSNTAMEQEDKL